MIEFHIDGSASVELSGEIDLANVGVVGAEVAAALDGEPREVVIRMSGVTFLDSTGLSGLLAAHRACQGRGARLVLANPSPVVTRLLTVTAMDRVFEIRRSPVQ